MLIIACLLGNAVIYPSHILIILGIELLASESMFNVIVQMETFEYHENYTPIV